MSEILLYAVRKMRAWFIGMQYRGTSLIRNNALRGPYSKTMPTALWWF